MITYIYLQSLFSEYILLPIFGDASPERISREGCFPDARFIFEATYYDDIKGLLVSEEAEKIIWKLNNNKIAPNELESIFNEKLRFNPSETSFNLDWQIDSQASKDYWKSLQ